MDMQVFTAMKWQISWQEKVVCSIKVKINKYLFENTGIESYKLFVYF